MSGIRLYISVQQELLHPAEPMAEFLQIPPEKLEDETLSAVLQDYVNREGTDYGIHELSLQDKVSRLRRQLDSGELKLLYDMESEQWDLLPTEEAEQLLGN